MTTQGADILIYRNKRYSIYTGYEDSIINEELLSLIDFNTTWGSSAITKGCSATYKIIEDRLVLDELVVHSTEEFKRINGVKPRISLFNRIYDLLTQDNTIAVYKKINYEMNCSGVIFANEYDKTTLFPCVDLDERCIIFHFSNGKMKYLEEHLHGVSTSSYSNEHIPMM